MTQFSLLISDPNLDLLLGDVDGYPNSVMIDYEN